jgi:hypothetical protein
MRLWSLHPKYLDPQGLVALWREALLAQAVLKGETKGYQHHPQLERFRSQSPPLASIGAFLNIVQIEATSRGYSFDRAKIHLLQECPQIQVTTGQLEYEWHHLLSKLSLRNPSIYRQFRDITAPDCHPLFQIQPGGVESWERGRSSA